MTLGGAEVALSGPKLTLGWPEVSLERPEVTLKRSEVTLKRPEPARPAAMEDLSTKTSTGDHAIRPCEVVCVSRNAAGARTITAADGSILCVH